MSFTETWQSASTNDERPEAPDPGNYDVRLEDAKALLSKKDEAWVILSWRVMSLRNKDHQWDELFGFRSQKAASITKKTIGLLGVDVDAVSSLDEIDSALKGLIGRMYEVEVKQSGQYRNTYVLGPAAEQPPAQATPGGDPTTPESDPDHVPF